MPDPVPTFDTYLTCVDGDKLAILKLIREFHHGDNRLPRPLADVIKAYNRVRAGERVCILRCVSRREACELYERFAAVGATVEGI